MSVCNRVAWRGQLAAVLVIVLAAYTAPGLTAMAIREEPALTLVELEGHVVVVRGTLLRYGSTPHTVLGVLVTDSSQITVAGEDTRPVRLEREIVIEFASENLDLEPLQSHGVEVTGILAAVPNSPIANPVVEVRTITPLESR